MTNLQNNRENKYGNTPVAEKDYKIQSEKDKQQAAQKQKEKQDASGKAANKHSNCS